MRIGMPTLVKLKKLEGQIKLCKELELDFIELNMNLPQYNTANLMSIDFKSLYKEGIEFTLHLPEDMDLGSFEPYVRNSYVNLVKQVIKIIPENVKKLNMHLHKGVYFTLPEQKVYLYREYKEQFQENLYYSFQEILGPARDKGIDICIENTGDFSKLYVQHALVNVLKEENAFLTWDVGHDASSGFLDTPFIKKHKNKIKHIHLHDAIGKKNHLELFSGNLDINSYIKLAQEKDFDIVIETKTEKALRNSVEKIKRLQKNL